MTKEQFEKAQELQRESAQLISARRMIDKYGLLRDSFAGVSLFDKKWIASDKRISEIVVTEIDARLEEISKEIELL